MKSAPAGDSTWRSALYATLIYGGLALGFTLIGMLMAPSSAQVGGTRPEETIPAHLAELAAFGLLLGAGSAVIYGRRGLPLVLLTPVLTVILDIDHLPVYLGYAQTIRPAHSLVFIFVALAITAVVVRALDVELVMAAAFAGHMAVDSGIFAPFSPLSFQYYQLDPYRLDFAVVAVLCALAAGVVLRMRPKSGPGEGGSVQEVV